MTTVLNYKDISFVHHTDGGEGELYDILTMNFVDYHGYIVSVAINRTNVGRRQVWLARFDRVTTEYSGELADVLEKVYDYYKSQHVKTKQEEPVEPF